MKVLFPRADCTAPQQYYTCASNGFNGCCSVDPCPLNGCPDPNPAPGQSTASQDQSPKSKASSAKSKDATADSNSTASNPTNTAQAPGPTQTQGTSPAAVSAAPSVTAQPSSLQSLTQSSIQLSTQPPIQSQTTSQQPAGSSPTSDTSSQPPFTIVVISSVQTSTSNGVALATTLLVTTTSYSAADPASQTSSSASSTQGSGPSSNAPIIGGVIGGIAGMLIAASLLWFCCLRRRKETRLREQNAAHGHEDDPREQGIDAHRAGDVIAAFNGPSRGGRRHSKVISRDLVAGSDPRVPPTVYGHDGEKKLPTPPVIPNRQAYTQEAVPYLDSRPVRPNLEMTGSSPDPTGFTPELSGVAAAHHPAELSPNPERLQINHGSSAYGEVGNAGPRTAGAAVMRSNMNLSSRGQNRRAPNGAAPHVLSWMEYSPNGTPLTDATDSSPPSGVWSSAASSNFVRNSGVSQDSSVHGWQRERRVRDGSGGGCGLEAIRDESQP